jgi:hypothetical protein
MKPSLEDLLPIIYQYYHPRSADQDGLAELEEFNETPEHLRLIAARKRAGYEADAWRGLLQRLRERFPSCTVETMLAPLQAGRYDAAYTGKLNLPFALPHKQDEYALGFLVSFIVPYFLIYRRRCRTMDSAPERPPASVDESEYSEYLEAHGAPILWEPLGYEFTAEEAPYAKGLIEEIQAAYPGYSPMPPELLDVKVPDAWFSSDECGTETVFAHVFTTNW